MSTNIVEQLPIHYMIHLKLPSSMAFSCTFLDWIVSFIVIDPHFRLARQSFRLNVRVFYMGEMELDNSCQVAQKGFQMTQTTRLIVYQNKLTQQGILYLKKPIKMFLFFQRVNPNSRKYQMK